MIILFSGFSPKGFVGDIDEVSVFNKTLSAVDIENHYAVGRYAPNFYLDLMKFDEAEGIYTFSDIGPITNGLKRDAGSYVDSKLSVVAPSCSESPVFALNPSNNKLSFVIMDSDVAPRDQTAIQNDPNLEGEEQLIASSLPYQGVCTLEWNDSDVTLSFTAGDSYSAWDEIHLDSRADYSLRMRFDGSTANIQIIRKSYENDDNWVEEAYDENIAFDTGIFPLDLRLRGGIGWQASLVDMHSSIRRILVEDTKFAEYRSAPFNSRIPYSGVQVFKSASPSINMVTDVSASDWGGLVEPDTYKSNSGNSYRVDTSGNKRYEGIKSEKFFIQNPDGVKVSLRVLASIHIEVFLYCYETDLITPIHAHPPVGSDWVTIEKVVNVPNAGSYALYATSSSYGEWYVDQMNVTLPSIAWFARPERDVDWMPLLNVVDSQYGGAVFPHPGKNLQVRGISKDINATIHDIQIEPKYAELGKIVWEDEIA